MVPIWIIAIAVTVASVVYGKYQLRKRLETATRLAATHGFELDAGQKPPPALGFDLFDVGRARKVSFQFWRPGRDDSVFDYQYTTGSGKNRTTRSFTCALVALPFDAPHTEIGPEGFWSSIGQKLGIRDIEVESPTFNDRYRVQSDDERFAVTMLDGRAIDWFLRDEGGRNVRFELRGPWLLCIEDRLDVERHFGFHDWAVGIPEHLPEVLTSLYPPSGRRR